ncbi:hypothetical protein GGS20DRAFT_589634 [Poronia punctata]|nr:hypothetical protein GGS20DRAFT_589634 [Poronia punctata]
MVRRLRSNSWCWASLVSDSADVIGVADLGGADPSPSMGSIVDWTSPRNIHAILRPIDETIVFSPDRTYLLAGLAGDLGQSLTTWMIDHGARYIVLTSRHPRIRNDWLETRGRITLIFRVSDVTDYPSLQMLKLRISEDMPPIKGVASGAMVLRDTPVTSITVEGMEGVLAPKVKGSLNLHELFINDDLDFFVLFSSVAAVVGNRGQASYSAANAFMSSLVAQRRERNLAGSVIHIGAVVGNGYLTRQVSQTIQDYLLNSGYLWMSERDFYQVFAEGVMASPPGQDSNGFEVMSGLNLRAGQDSDYVWADNPKFQHCLSIQRSILPSLDSAEAPICLKDALAGASSLDEIHSSLADAFVQKLRTLLLLNPDIPILESSTDELGIDSLIAASLRMWFSTELDVDIPIMRILGGNTVTELVEYAASKIESANANASGADHLAMSDTSKGPSRSSDSVTDMPPVPSPVSSPDPDVNPSDTQMIELQGGNLARKVPQSFAQARFWFLQSLLDDKTTSNVTCLLSITGALRTADLDGAVKMVGERHEALRTRFFEESGIQWQGVMKTSLLELELGTLTDDDDLDKHYTAIKERCFDLEKGETMRILLLTVSSEFHYLVVSYHHIIMDGTSFIVLLSELADLYAGKTPPKVGAQYPEYSTIQRENLLRGHFKDHIEYWRNEYREIPAPLAILPMSQATAREPMADYDFHSADTVVSSRLQGHILELCRKEKSTAFHFYVAIFKVMLTRLSEAEDLSIGISHAGRTDETVGSIGKYLNLLPLRLRSPKSASFSESLSEVKKQANAATSNSAVPIDVLFSELDIPRHTRHSPLFQAFVNYRRVNEAQKFDNCTIRGERYTIGRIGYDVSLDVIDDALGNCSLILMVQKSLYAQEDATTLLCSLLKLADVFSQDASLPVGMAPLYDNGMVEEALGMGRGQSLLAKHVLLKFERSNWDTIIHALNHLSQVDPSRVALKDGLGYILSRERLCSEINRIAWGLPRVSAILKESGASVVLVHSETRDYIRSLGADDTVHFLDIDALQTQDGRGPIPNRAKGDSTGVILYTSGSTGVPKGIGLSHRSIQMHMEGCISQWGLDEEVVLQRSAFSFDFSIFQIYLALLTGGMCYVVPKEARGDGLLIAKLISGEGITVTGGVPTECLTWLQHSEYANWRASKYKMMVCGGEVYIPTLVRALRRVGRNNLTAMNIYGPSEVTIAATAFEVKYDLCREDVEAPIPIGFALPNYSIAILDDDLRPVTVVDGQRFVDSTFVSRGAAGQQMHLTGDRGRFRRSDGALLFEGRIAHDTQVKLRGVRIDLQDVESAIVSVVKGSIISAAGSVRGRDGKFLVAHVVTKLPATALPLPNNFDAFESSNTGLSIAELALANLWLSVLMDGDIPVAHPISAESDFFRSGGNSILLMRLQARIMDSFGVRPSLFQLFSATSLGEMTANLDTAGATAIVATRQQINWNHEIELDLSCPIPSSPANRSRVSGTYEDVLVFSPCRTVVLTGATGHLGQYILSALLANEHIQRIYCIAVRSPGRLKAISDPRVHVYGGDLTLPRLGLEPGDAETIFQAADAVVHNGADVSFLKTYTALRSSNVDSTKELIHLISKYLGVNSQRECRRTFHYISTVGVAQLQSSISEFSPIPASSIAEPTDGSNGYVASKWTSERVLERLAGKMQNTDSGSADMPHIVIHRPSSIFDLDACEPPKLDIIQNLLEYSRRLRATPKDLSCWWKGYIDLIGAEDVARGVVQNLIRSSTATSLTQHASYEHHSGVHEIRKRKHWECMKLSPLMWNQ